MIWGTTIGVIKGDTRSLDYRSIGLVRWLSVICDESFSNVRRS